MTYHDSLLNRVERLARQMGRTDEIVARLQQQEYDLRHARDAAVRELQQLRSERDTLAAEVATLNQQVDTAQAALRQERTLAAIRDREVGGLETVVQKIRTLCVGIVGNIDVRVIRAALAEQYVKSSVTLTSSPPTSATQVLDDSSGADGPGQS